MSPRISSERGWRLAARVAALALLWCGCPAGDDDAGDDDATEQDGWYDPDPEGRITEDDRLGQPPEMVVITSDELVSAWQPYALRRTLSGVHAVVVGLGEIQQAYDGVDDAERVREFLVDAHGEGVRFALLGGDADVVPFRRVEDTIQLLDGAYSTDGPCDAYFSNLDVDWDADGDGVWGEDGDDLALADLRDDEVFVGRVPVGDAAELERYLAKLVRYETAPGGRETYPLLMSDIASSIPLLGDIDGAEGVEVSVDEFFPDEFVDHARRLYATEGAADKFGGEVLTPDKVAEALDDGYLLAYHNGHGTHDELTGALDSAFVEGLTNELPPVLLSCSCLTGNFADVADGASHEWWDPQGPGDDSAGELLITGSGGAVAYVGSTALGLGPLGGSQFLHAAFEGLFEEELETLGEVFSYGRARMREIELTILNVPMPINDASERWTQLIVILLGDPSLRLWIADAVALEVDHPADYGPGYQELVVTVREAANGDPKTNATVVLHKDGDFLIQKKTGAQGQATFRFVPYGPGELEVGVSGTNLLPQFATIAPRE